MNSCLYSASVMHHRLHPKKHYFNYKVFMFYLDLDEIETVTKKFPLISRNKFNFFSFRNKEHVQVENLEKPLASIKENIVLYLKENGFNYTHQKIMLLTNLNTFGYNFNPVSFYFIINDKNIAECAVAEVSNTFREMKLYFLGGDTLQEGKFKLTTPKYFYVSPFIDHDAQFEFSLQMPNEKLNLRIDDSKNNQRLFVSTVTGAKKNLTNLQLILYAIRFPLIPLRIMFLIHWNALILWMKKINFHKKFDYQELQKDVLKKHTSIK